MRARFFADWSATEFFKSMSFAGRCAAYAPAQRRSAPPAAMQSERWIQVLVQIFTIGLP